MIDLFLFSTNAPFARACCDAGVAGVVIDWENRGKRDRQAGFDTQINGDTARDLMRVRQAGCRRIVCRINGLHDGTEAEVEEAISGGASEILLPMVREPREALQVWRMVAGRAGLGILIETRQAAARAGEFGSLPLARIYVGLNDLSIELGNRSLFRALADGTVDLIRRDLRHSTVPFGIGGLTVPEGGYPLPCSLLAGELARLNASFTFLRRSFLRDIHGRKPEVEIPRILAGIAEKRSRSAAEIERDRQAFLEAAEPVQGAPQWMAAAAG